jgi:hypothetical protein
MSNQEATEEDRRALRRWLDTWNEASPALEAERWNRVATMSDEDAWRQTLDLLADHDVEWTGDGGDGLVRCQDVFSRARARAKK